MIFKVVFFGISYLFVFWLGKLYGHGEACVECEGLKIATEQYNLAVKAFDEAMGNAEWQEGVKVVHGFVGREEDCRECAEAGNCGESGHKHR